MNQPSITADKNILERPRSYRNPRTARAIRETRDRLQSSKLQNPKFSGELLSSYLRTASISTLIMPLLVVLTSGFGVFLFDEQRLIGWAAITLAAYAVQATLVRRASSGQPTQRDIARRERYLIAVHAVTGVCWGAFAYAECVQCTLNSYVFYKGVVLLIAIAATAMSSFALRRLPLLFFAVPLCLLYLAGSSFTDTIDMSILALLVSFFIDPLPLPLTMIFLGLSFFLIGLILPNFNAMAMEPLGRVAGTGSSVIGFVMTGLGAVLGGVSANYYDQTLHPLLWSFVIYSVVVVIIVYAVEKGQILRPHPQAAE